MKRTESKLTQQLQDIPTKEEIALEMGMTREELDAFLVELQTQTSLESTRSALDPDSDEIGDFLADPRQQPVREAEHHLLREKLEEALGRIPPREARILRLWSGLEDGYAYTLEEIAQKLELSRERVRQLEGKALYRLRISSAILLREYLADLDAEEEEGYQYSGQ